jgi:hypothetical protein
LDHETHARRARGNTSRPCAAFADFFALLVSLIWVLAVSLLLCGKCVEDDRDQVEACGR